MQTQSRASDEKGQVDRASAEHGDVVFKHPDGTGRPKEDDCQYAETAFRETPVILIIVQTDGMRKWIQSMNYSII
jgi:hypothetical protein